MGDRAAGDDGVGAGGMWDGGAELLEENELELAEQRRLAALREYHILDTLPEQGFEDATELVSLICGTPISMVTLVDADRQWFKSERGLGKRESSRSGSLCAYAVGIGKTLVVTDVLEDGRFRDHPMVMGEPGIRFYAGAPLIDKDGFALGTICVVDTLPRELSAKQVACLEALARQVTSLLEQRRTIAAQTRSARDLQQVAARLTLAAEAAELGIFSWEAAGDRALWENDRIYQIYGRTREQGPVSAGEFVAEVVYAEYAASYIAALERTMDTGERFFWGGKIRRGDGKDGWLELSGQVELSAEGVPVRLLGTALDITARREAELALRSSEERLRLAQESANMASWDWELETGRFSWDGDTRRLYGRSPEELAHVVQIFPLVHEEDVAAVRNSLAPALEGSGAFHTEFRVRWPDGTIHWLVGHGVPVLSRGKAVRVVGTNIDVTEQRRTEAALRQSEKLAAVGRLASTIAHEMNNPLESVTNLMYLALGDAELPVKTRGYLETAERELRRVSAIATQTLRFHKQATGPRAVSSKDLFEGVLSTYQGRLVNAGIAPEQRLRAPEPVVCFDGEIRQVLNNLVGNAIDAMLGGGQLLLRSRRATEWASGRAGVALTVADTGSGMSAATLRRVFEAFFTTKGIGGTGLGLWVSREIAERHGGTLRVRSSQAAGRRGTVCVLFLPLAARIRQA